MVIKGKKFTVIGMGETGIETANFLVRKGAQATLLDRNSPKEIGPILNRLDASVKTIWKTEEPPLDSECVVLSPGVDIESPFLDGVKKKNIPVIGEVEFASRFNGPPIIAITGSNGKTTTCSLIEKILEAGDKKVRVGGNIGTPFIALIEGSGSLDYMVLELSSFQLESIDAFRPSIAAILNLSPDHLDRHKTFENYVSLKARIAKNQMSGDYLILNADDSKTALLGQDLPMRKLFFSIKHEVELGSWVDKGVLHVRVPGCEFDIGFLKDLPQSMRWQTENVLAAMIVSALVGIPGSVVAKAVRRFDGLEHRLEWVRSFQGVDYVNDSKGTNIGSVVKALESMNRPVILIFGGRDKGVGFDSLLPLFKSKVKQLILIGESQSRVKKILNGRTPPFEEVETMEQAVRHAAQAAKSGDVVLLSPGCASFDMFKNYAVRGETFKSLVWEMV